MMRKCSVSRGSIDEMRDEVGVIIDLSEVLPCIVVLDSSSQFGHAVEILSKSITHYYCSASAMFLIVMLNK